MRKASFAKAVCAVSLSALCIMGASACSSSTSEQVAATVNGTNIMEADVTSSVEKIRTQMGLDDNDSWAEWLATYGYTPSTVREEVIESLEAKELIIQECNSRGLTVEDSEIDSYVDSMKSYYDSDEKWAEALESVGMTEAEYRENIKTSLLQQALKENLVTEPTDEEVLSYINENIANYNGAKKSSHILFDSSDEATAQEVLDKIESGELDFAEAASQYSTDSSKDDGGNVGWDKLTSFVDEYQQALDALSKDQVSGLVTSTYGIHIIKCTDVFQVDTTTNDEGDEVGSLTSLDQIPDEIVESAKSALETSSQSTNYSNWLSEAKEAADITINDMPSGLSYDVDMSAYTTDESTDDSTEESTDDTDGSDSSDGSTDSSTDGSTDSSNTKTE